MKFHDSILGVIFVCLSLIMLSMARHFPSIQGQNIGPGFFPSLIAGGMLVFGILLAIRGFVKKKSVPIVTLGEWIRSPRLVSNFCLVLSCLVFYILAANLLGFLVSVFLILGLLLAWLRRKIWSSVFIALVVTVAVHQTFSRFLMIPLPEGIFSAIVR